MKATISTPLIEAVLSNPEYQIVPRTLKGERPQTSVIHPKDHDRYVAAVNDLVTGLEEEKIFNVVLKDAKDTISRVLERALTPVCDEWGRVARLSDSSLYTPSHISEAWEDVSHYGSFNQYRGRITRLEKWMKLYTSPQFGFLKLPEKLIKATLDVIAFYREAAQFQVILDQIKPFIVKGRRPAENPVEKDLTNTGICPICEKRFKLNGYAMVDHGFTISNGAGQYFGYRAGPCFGVRYPAYEISNLGNIAYAPILVSRMEATVEYLRKLNNGGVESLTRIETERIEGTWGTRPVEKVYAKGTVEYQSLLLQEIMQAERGLRWVLDTIEWNVGKIKNWKAEPLKYGQ